MAQEKAIVVGAGGISNAWFPPLLNEKVNIVGVSDLNLENARKQIEKYGVECEVSTDLPTLIKRTRPDFVVDLTIPDAHCEVTCTALKNGCHV